MLRIEIDKASLLWDVVRSPGNIRYEFQYHIEDLSIPSNFITIPEPRHTAGENTKLALEGFGVPNFKDFTTLLITPTDKDLS